MRDIIEKAKSLSIKASEYVRMRSENVAGAVSLAGSSILILGNDVQNLAAAAVFTVSEITLAKKGHTTAGYSVSAAGFTAGDLCLAFSDAVQSGSPLQMTLFGMAGAWGLASTRYPLEKLSEKLNSEKLKNVSDNLASLCGGTNLGLRLPGIYSAASSGNIPLTAAISLWGISDILSGRLQEKIKPALDLIKQKIDIEVDHDNDLKPR